MSTSESSEPVATGRFEWERIVRRVQLPIPRMLVALLLATFADSDGSRVRPGERIIAAIMGQSERNVRRHLDALQELGLLTVVSRGGGRGRGGRATEYQLAIPTDLLERGPMLGPDFEAVPADTQMSARSPEPVADGPVDNTDPEDIQESPQLARVIPIDRTYNSVTKPIDRTSGAIDRTPRCPPTNHLHQPPLPSQISASDVTTDRAREPVAVGSSLLALHTIHIGGTVTSPADEPALPGMNSALLAAFDETAAAQALVDSGYTPDEVRATIEATRDALTRDTEPTP